MAAAAVLIIALGVYFFMNRNKNTATEYAGNTVAPDINY